MHDTHNTMTIACLFKDEPANWGLRGDPYLWKEFQRHFATVAWPESIVHLQEKLEQAFLDLTGHSVHKAENFYLPQFAHGGMSSGVICTEFWRDSVIPLLMQRYLASASKNARID
ncbi:MobA protein [Undibacterium sp. TJN19]|uniref:MobA protein n=1 Tax=Undibacterium sp. TJN19 TaxID=3413055 RepID=UPI003BF3BB75